MPVVVVRNGTLGSMIWKTPSAIEKSGAHWCSVRPEHGHGGEQQHPHHILRAEELPNAALRLHAVILS